MKLYTGRRSKETLMVIVDGKPLNPRYDLLNHSPTGFEWGYGGSGPAQLALAIVADYLGNDERAILFHQSFKWAVIAKLPNGAWSLSGDEIRNALASLNPRRRNPSG